MSKQKKGRGRIRREANRLDPAERKLVAALQAEEAELRKLGDYLKMEADGKGFALFIVICGKPKYISNCARETVVDSLKEWLTKIPENAVMTPKGDMRLDPGDRDAFGGYERIKLERTCVAIAEKLEQASEMCLFLFDFGDDGSMAFRTNMPYARKNVQMWVDNELSKR